MSENPLIEVLHSNKPERVPVLITTGFIAIRHSPFSPGEVREGGEKLALAQMRFQKIIDADAVPIYYDVNYIPEGFGCGIRFTRTGPVISRTLDIHEDLLFTETESIRAVKTAVKYASETTDKPVMPLFEGPFTTATRILDVEKLLKAMYLDPERVIEVMKVITDILMEFSDILIEKGADFMYIPDPSSTPDMISPNHACRFSFPFLKKLINHIRKKIPVMVHMCGDTENIWTYLPSLGGNAYSLDQKINLKKARDKMKDVVLAGNVDPVGVLLFGTEELVRRDALRSINEGGPEKFILMPGCGVPPETPVENLKVMVEVAKGWMV